MFFYPPKKFFITLVLLLLALPFFISADYGGQKTSFFIDPSYDLRGRAQLTAELIRITPELYFYLDATWWNSLNATAQLEAKAALQDLGEEFSNRIYPQLTDYFGSEWKPGIDSDDHITVLFHPMKEAAGGYINTADEYSRLQNAFSNQREMIYLNSSNLTSVLAKSYIAHEFVHLITFNQKERKRGKVEEDWLNEIRADYAPTLLGYDNDFQQSNLKNRLMAFLQFPTDSLVEWKGQEADYGVINLFGQYLVEHYGKEILIGSLHSNKVGIASLNQALVNNGFIEDFAQIFQDWTIASLINNCSISEKYCYLNPNLKNFKVIPKINYLPYGAETSLALTQETKNWAANWYKALGGKGDLKLEFAGFSEIDFKVPYVVSWKNGKTEISFLDLNSFQSGRLIIDNFSADANWLVIMPFIGDKLDDFSRTERAYPFFWSISTQSLTNGSNSQSEDTTSSTEDIKLLLEKISFLEKQLTVLRKQLQEAMGQTVEENGDSGIITYNLQIGERGSEITILQQWLAKDASIYPEGLITGYFGQLTQAAVIRFQNKYASEILTPWGLTNGTGFVGSTTRAKLNALYSN